MSSKQQISHRATNTQITMTTQLQHSRRQKLSVRMIVQQILIKQNIRDTKDDWPIKTSLKQKVTSKVER